MRIDGPTSDKLINKFANYDVSINFSLLSICSYIDDLTAPGMSLSSCNFFFVVAKNTFKGMFDHGKV